MSLALRLRSDTAGVTSRLREITAALDPALRVDAVRALDAIHRQHQEGNYLGAFALATVTLSVLLLSAAGMYALMSFTVNQRRGRSGSGRPSERHRAACWRASSNGRWASSRPGPLPVSWSRCFSTTTYRPKRQAAGTSPASSPPRRGS